MLYSFSNRPIRTEFGGVPITVAIPPEFAEKAIPSITLREKFFSLFAPPFLLSIKRFITERAIGSITTVLAVLDIHILIKAVAIIKPRMTLLGEVPVLFIIVSAILLCRLTFSSARAKTNPPKKRKTIELP